MSEPDGDAGSPGGVGVANAADARCSARISRSSALAFSLDGAP